VIGDSWTDLYSAMIAGIIIGLLIGYWWWVSTPL
jgi:hypothetical protein